MGPESARLHLPPDLHQHDDPPDEPETDRTAIPDTPEDDPSSVSSVPARVSSARLWRENGVVYYEDAPGGKAEPARLVWSRPLSGRGGPVSVMLAGKKRELAYFPSLDCLSPESRAVALAELNAGMVLPKISVVHQVKPRFGNYYWDVETDLGRRRFLLSSPENNTFRPRPDVIVVRDVSGNCYEIPSVSSLDKNSLREMDRAI